MNIKNKHSGFTLVELVVVMAVLIILGTIAFISLQGYSASTRNSTRISNASVIEQGLELFFLNSGKFPDPTNPYIITYGSDTAWIQGTLGEQTIENISKINEVPVDPLTNKEYTYSVTNSKNEYSIAFPLEGDLLSKVIIDDVFAGSGKVSGMLMVKGNYNGRVLKIPKGDNIIVLSVPSIIASTGATLEYLIQNNKLAYKDFKNLPFNYDGSKFEINGEENLNLVNYENLVVYSGSIENLKGEDDIYRQEMVLKINQSYDGVDILNIGNIKEVAVLNTSNANEVCELGRLLVNNNVGGNLDIGTDLETCSGSLLPENGAGGAETIEIIFINADNEAYTCDLCD